MTVAVMQPYFLPYVGYFQLIQAVDTFVVYDNIQYTKKGWINRNRILVGGKDEYLTLPLKKTSDFLHVNQRELADSWSDEKIKMLRKIKEVYRNSPQFNVVFPLIESILNFDKKNLFDFIYNSIISVSVFLNIKTNFVISSTVKIDHEFKGEEKVIALCKKLNAKNYINPIGGVELYNTLNFLNEGIKLQFIRTDNITYKQQNNIFVPSLSIIDVLMYNSKEKVTEIVANRYTLQ